MDGGPIVVLCEYWLGWMNSRMNWICLRNCGILESRCDQEDLTHVFVNKLMSGSLLGGTMEWIHESGNEE